MIKYIAKYSYHDREGNGTPLQYKVITAPAMAKRDEDVKRTLTQEDSPPPLENIPHLPLKPYQMFLPLPFSSSTN